MKKIVLLMVMMCVGGVRASDSSEVLLVAGKASHGAGEHEYPAGCEVLARALNESGLNLKARVEYEKWPDRADLEACRVLVVYCDGNDAHLAKGHEDDLLALSNRGTGLVFLHYAVDGTEGLLDETLMKVIGAYYEDETSENPLWTVTDPVLAAHPILQGVTPVELSDEWYYNLKFGEITPVLSAVPPEGGAPEALAWTFGQHAFGFTGGHFHRNWSDESFRKLVLNAIVWASGHPVPADGVESAPPVVVQHKTILHAIAKGDPVDVENHLLLGADVNEKNKQGWTPLHFATVRGRTGCAEVLIAAGAELNPKTGTEKTPLHFAADRGYLEIVERLVEHGADRAAKDDEGWTPLHYAAEKDHVDLAAYLIRQGAAVDAISRRGGTPLHEASASAGPEMIRLLLDSGADQSIQAANGKTPLDYAVELGNEPAAALLKSRLRL